MQSKTQLQMFLKQSLLPQKALERKHKKYIVETLLQGRTNLLQEGEKFADHGFSEVTYEYASKCLNMLLHDLCSKRDSYIVRDFRKCGVLQPQNIIDIRNLFSSIVQEDDDINVSAINEVMKDIEHVINYKFSMFFLRFSEAVIKVRGKQALKNDWYDYVEYGTNNDSVIELQKHGFTREQALQLFKLPYSPYITMIEGELFIDRKIMKIASKDLLVALNTVMINYPELFK